eukprot:473753-Prymnesium_polylepis.2
MSARLLSVGWRMSARDTAARVWGGGERSNFPNPLFRSIRQPGARESFVSRSPPLTLRSDDDA